MLLIYNGIQKLIINLYNLYINKQTLILQEEKAKRHQELIQQKKQEILEKRKLEKNCK